MTGYTKLASFMSNDHAVFKKFRTLAIRDLLYLQAELVDLAHRYDEIAKSDARQQDERKNYGGQWYLLNSSKSRDFGGQQWELALTIRDRLREYYSALEQYQRIASSPKPRESDLQPLRDWIIDPDQGGKYGLIGRDLGGFLQKGVYESEFKDDLIMPIAHRGEDDVFTRIMKGPMLRALHRVWQHHKAPLPIDQENQAGPENESHFYEYRDKVVLRVIYVIGTVSSSLTPIISIVALYFVQSMALRLGLVCVFTLLFSLSLALATKSRRIEIFAATSAFAGVQVVFIGTTSSNTGA